MNKLFLILTISLLSTIGVIAQGIDFFHGTWAEALEKSKNEGQFITDEALAVERYLETDCPGSDDPVIVEGSRDNIKITRPEDIAIAKAIITAQQEKL